MKLNFKTLCAAGALLLCLGDVFAMDISEKSQGKDKQSVAEVVIGDYSYPVDSQELELHCVELTELPKEIGNLRKLRNLDLRCNQLMMLPKEIGNLTNLTNLCIHSNRLTELPKELGNLINLKALHITWNKLMILPTEIGNLKNLTYLNLWNNQLTILPREIGNLKNLTTLSLSENQLATLGGEIGNLVNLNLLDVSDNQLTNLPKEIGNLTNLTSLYLHGTQIESLPKEIENLPNLSDVTLPTGCDFSIYKFSTYQGGEFLDLANKNLDRVPCDIVMLKDLKKLNLSNNDLKSIPLFMRNVKNLEEIDISGNNIESLPTEVWPFPPTLKTLTVDGFLLKNIPDDRIESITNMRELNKGKINTECFARLITAKINNQPSSNKLLLESLGGTCVIKLKEPPEAKSTEPSSEDKPSISETCKI